MPTEPKDEKLAKIDHDYQIDEESNATEEGMPLPPEGDPDDESGAIDD